MTVMRNILSKYHIDEDDVGAGCLNTRSVEGPSCKWPLCLLPSGRHSQSTLRFASNLARHFLNEHGRDVDGDGDEDDIDDDDLDDQAVTLSHSQSMLRFASHLNRHFEHCHEDDGDDDDEDDDDGDNDNDDQAVTLYPRYALHRTSVLTFLLNIP